MTVTCAACGAMSRDAEFCEHCHADLRAAPQPPVFCPLGNESTPLSQEQLQALSQPEASVYLATLDQWWRVHWLDRSARPDWHLLWHQRREVALPGLPMGHTVAVEQGTWIFVPTRGACFAPWLAVHDEPPMRHLEVLLEYLGELVELLENLHRLGFFWMNFDPGELERDEDGRLQITNLDLRMFAHGEAPYSLAVHQAYAAPEAVYLRTADLGPQTDVFHLSIFCYYWLARHLPDGLPGEGLEAIDFHLPALRTFAPDLPEGIAAVLARGMTPEARHRFATPTQLLQNLRDAFDRAQHRRAFRGHLDWDIGSHSRTGRTKTALKRSNEDQTLVRRFFDPDRALLAVADGITTCDIGNGALASLITTIVVENALDRMTDPVEFPALVREACYKGSQTLLDWALEKGYRDQIVAGRDLMGTTLTVAWLQDTTAWIGNLGDSRAYLMDQHRIEQLTVDGDLASDLLAHGSPPEQVRELGLMTKALRKCIGGCDLDAEKNPVVVPECSEPSIGMWHLLPGDILVLCSDGLVEEGAFLEPEILVEIVRNHPRASAQELADLFAEAADALQRPPTILEPDGFGDNISCIVVKVKEHVASAT